MEGCYIYDNFREEINRGLTVEEGKLCENKKKQILKEISPTCYETDCTYNNSCFHQNSVNETCMYMNMKKIDKNMKYNNSNIVINTVNDKSMNNMSLSLLESISSSSNVTAQSTSNSNDCASVSLSSNVFSFSCCSSSSSSASFPTSHSLSSDSTSSSSLPSSSSHRIQMDHPNMIKQSSLTGELFLDNCDTYWHKTIIVSHSSERPSYGPDVNSLTHLDKLHLFHAILALYMDQIRPYQSEVVRRLREISARDVVIKNALHFFKRLTDVFIVGKTNHSRTIVYFREKPNCFKGWIDPKSEENPYSEDVWNDIKAHFKLLVNNPIRNEETGMMNYQFSGGRYECATYLKSRKFLSLMKHSLGEVCHIVQLSVKCGILSYNEGTLQPTETLHLNHNAFMNLFSNNGVNGRNRLSCSNASQQGTRLKNVEEVRKYVAEVLKLNQNAVLLSHLRCKLLDMFGVSINPTDFGFAKLSDFLLYRLANVCCIVRHGDRQLVVHSVGNIPDSYSPLKPPKKLNFFGDVLTLNQMNYCNNDINNSNNRNSNSHYYQYCNSSLLSDMSNNAICKPSLNLLSNNTNWNNTKGRKKRNSKNSIVGNSKLLNNINNINNSTSLVNNTNNSSKLYFNEDGKNQINYYEDAAFQIIKLLEGGCNTDMSKLADAIIKHLNSFSKATSQPSFSSCTSSTLVTKSERTHNNNHHHHEDKLINNNCCDEYMSNETCINSNNIGNCTRATIPSNNNANFELTHNNINNFNKNPLNNNNITDYTDQLRSFLNEMNINNGNFQQLKSVISVLSNFINKIDTNSNCEHNNNGVNEVESVELLLKLICLVETAKQKLNNNNHDSKCKNCCESLCYNNIINQNEFNFKCNNNNSNANNNYKIDDNYVNNLKPIHEIKNEETANSNIQKVNPFVLVKNRQQQDKEKINEIFSSKSCVLNSSFNFLPCDASVNSSHFTSDNSNSRNTIKSNEKNSIIVNNNNSNSHFTLYFSSPCLSNSSSNVSFDDEKSTLEGLDKESNDYKKTCYFLEKNKKNVSTKCRLSSSFCGDNLAYMNEEKKKEKEEEKKRSKSYSLFCSNEYSNNNVNCKKINGYCSPKINDYFTLSNNNHCNYTSSNFNSDEEENQSGCTTSSLDKNFYINYDGEECYMIDKLLHDKKNGIQQENELLYTCFKDYNVVKDANNEFLDNIDQYKDEINSDVYVNTLNSSGSYGSINNNNTNYSSDNSIIPLLSSRTHNNSNIDDNACDNNNNCCIEQLLKANYIINSDNDYNSTIYDHENVKKHLNYEKELHTEINQQNENSFLFSTSLPVFSSISSFSSFNDVLSSCFLAYSDYNNSSNSNIDYTHVVDSE